MVVVVVVRAFFKYSFFLFLYFFTFNSHGRSGGAKGTEVNTTWPVWGTANESCYEVIGPMRSPLRGRRGPAVNMLDAFERNELRRLCDEICRLSPIVPRCCLGAFVNVQNGAADLGC